MAHHSDPAGQFEWIENVLRDAEQHSNLVSVCTLTVNLATSWQLVHLYLI